VPPSPPGAGPWSCALSITAISSNAPIYLHSLCICKIEHGYNVNDIFIYVLLFIYVWVIDLVLGWRMIRCTKYSCAWITKISSRDHLFLNCTIALRSDTRELCIVHTCVTAC
jgi:hypothetical protein